MIELVPKYRLDLDLESNLNEPLIVIQSVDAGGALAARLAADEARQAVIDAADTSRLTIGTITTVDADADASATIVGPPGSQVLNLWIPKGHDGASSFRVLINAPIGGQRVVYIDHNGDVQYASNDLVMSMNTVFGMTTEAAVAGSTINILKIGFVEEPSWSFTLGQPVFLGMNGTITQTPPTNTAFSLIVGFPVTPTKLFVSFREPISLA